MYEKRQDLHVEAFTDANWAGSMISKRSTSGYRTFVGGNPVTCCNKKQLVVARLSTEAEFRAIAHKIYEMLCICGFLRELSFHYQVPIQLYYDNKATISIAHDPVQNDRTNTLRLIGISSRRSLQVKQISIPFVKTEDQLADVFTKSLCSPSFNMIVCKLGMHSLYIPT